MDQNALEKTVAAAGEDVEMIYDCIGIEGLASTSTNDRCIVRDGKLVKVLIDCELTKPKKFVCCENEIRPSRAVEFTKIKDRARDHVPTYLVVARRRSQCPICRRVYKDSIPGVGKSCRTTDRLREDVAMACINGTFLSVSKKYFSDERYCRNESFVFNERTLANYKPDPPIYLGIDITRLQRKRHTVLIDLKTGALIDIAETKGFAEVATFLSKLEFRSGVKVVCHDLSPGFRNIVRDYFPSAVSVIDRFHLCAQVQRQLRSGLTKLGVASGSAPCGEDGMDIRTAFLKLSARLTFVERADLCKFIVRNQVAGKLLEMKDRFMDLHNHHQRKAGETSYEAWVSEMQPDIRRFYRSTIEMMQRWDTEVFNYFDFRGDLGEKINVTNARVEQLNGELQRLCDAGRRYDFETLRQKSLMRWGGSISPELAAVYYMQPSGSSPTPVVSDSTHGRRQGSVKANVSALLNERLTHRYHIVPWSDKTRRCRYARQGDVRPLIRGRTLTYLPWSSRAAGGRHASDTHGFDALSYFEDAAFEEWFRRETVCE